MRFNLWEDCNRVPLTELLSFVVDNRGKTVPTAPSGHKLIATNCVTNNTLFPVYEKIRYLSEETYQTWFRAHPIPGDILFVNKGTPGRVCLVPDPVDFCIAQDMIALRADESKIYPKYLFAVLRSREIQQQIYNTNVGDVIPHFKKQFLDQLLIPIPERSIQESIGDLYYVLSLKAERNKKINDNLQQQMQTLFADWLSANSEYATEMALGDICSKVTDGSHFSPKDDPTSSIPMLSVKDMREFDFDLTSCKHICEDDYDKMVVNDCVPQVNDILVAKDGSYLKEIFICNEQRKLAILSSIAIFRPNTTVIHPEILLAFLKSPRVLQEVRDNYVSGSALPRIVLKDFKKLVLALPDMDTQKLIAPLFTSIREQIAVNVAQNKYLTQLRDALLPKMMSGELNVDNIQL